MVEIQINKGQVTQAQFSLSFSTKLNTAFKQRQTSDRVSRQVQELQIGSVLQTLSAQPETIECIGDTQTAQIQLDEPGHIGCLQRANQMQLLFAIQCGQPEFEGHAGF